MVIYVGQQVNSIFIDVPIVYKKKIIHQTLT